MALGYALQGGANIIVTKQSVAAAETITLDGGKINDGASYSIIGGTFEILTAAAGTIDVQLGGTSILAAPQSTAAPGNFNFILSNDSGDLLAAGGDDITIITSGVVACQVNLYLSGRLESVV